ncbi:MAG: CDP-glycerol glycerophosphotransferase family protein [Brachybacterium sp.]|nr:CDP-glycerol glycerophosphotransferase family protein [Brachybacterium sp.]
MTSIGIAKVARMLSVWPVIVNTLALIAMVVALALDDTLLTVLAALLPLLIIGWRKRRALFQARGRVGGVSRFLTARYLLLATAMVQLHDIGQLGGTALGACLLLALACALEPMLRALSKFAVPCAAHMPGSESRTGPTFHYGIAFPFSMLSLLVITLSSLAPMPLLLAALLLAAVTVVVFVVAMLDVVRGIQERRRDQANLPQALERMAPVFYVYWHAPPRSTFQVTMWLSHLERLGVPFAIVVRTAGTFRQIQGATAHPVILRRSLTDLDDLIVPSVRGVFYVNNAMRNNHMVRYSQLLHIQLLHGESDKASSATPIIRMYDRNFVAGQAAIDRFEEFGVAIPPEIFRIVGRPQVEDVEPERALIRKLTNVSVLYAPTWLGNQTESNYSSLRAGPAIVQGLLGRGCRVVFRPHPYSSRSPELRAACEEIWTLLEADAAQTGREHLYGSVSERKMSVADCFNAVDAMISDVSAVAGDFLHSGKPFAMVSPRAAAQEFTEQFPMARAAYVLEADGAVPRALEAVLDELLRTDTRREERHRWAAYYLGDFPRETYAQRFVEVARDELGLGEDVPELPATGHSGPVVSS